MPRFTSTFWFPLTKIACVCFVWLSFSACRGKSPTVDGQKFAVHTVMDQTQGLPFLALMAPAGWEVSGQVNWKYADASNPVSSYIQAVNPAKPESVTFFPTTACYWLQGASARNRPGSLFGGMINLQPMSPENALRSAVAKIYRPNRPDLQLIGVRRMPGLAALLQSDPKSYQGIGLKIQYTENRVPLEEEFYALYFYVPIPYDGPQGHSVQLDWGLDRVHSFRAPVGTLDLHRDTFAYVVRSIKINPAWSQRSTEIRNSLNDQFNRNLAQGYAGIAAAGQRSRQISANNDAMIASMDGQRASANASSQGSAGSGRSSNDTFDDYIRGVDTMNDPSNGGTTQLSNTEQYHWTNEYGNYSSSNDPNYDPNKDSNVTWQQMTPAE